MFMSGLTKPYRGVLPAVRQAVLRRWQPCLLARFLRPRLILLTFLLLPPLPLSYETLYVFVERSTPVSIRPPIAYAITTRSIHC
jgi:hypothetical protein